MTKGKSAIDMSNVRISCVDDAPPITDWLRYRIKLWIKEKYGEDVEVELVTDDAEMATS